jgi:NADPH-dependent curcumin reductase CurA
MRGMSVNRAWRLAARPVGMAKRSDWNFVEETVGEPAVGEMLVRVQFVSLDPAMRGWMNEGRSYIAPVGIGDVMRAGAIGQVVSSKNAAFAAGDTVMGSFGVQEFAISDGKGVTKVDAKAAPLPVFLGALGMPGITAHVGLLDVGKPKAGDTVVVSGAAGAVGMVVGQIAKLHGCRVIGIAGGPEKCEWLTRELGFDAAIDYKKDDVKKALRTHAPKGVDVYFDNVGGEILEIVLGQIARGARIVICGAISQYNATAPMKGPANYMMLLVARASMTGFVVFDYADRYAECVKELATWRAQGKLKSREDVARGIETFPETLLKLFSGENIGKLVLQVAD